MNNITSYYGDLGIFLYYTPIVSAFMAAFALLANRRRTPSQTWLALVLVTFGTGMAASFLFDRYFSASHSEIFRPVNFIFSTANSIVILFYYVSLMRPQLLTRKYMLYFSGGWALFSIFVLLPGTFSEFEITPIFQYVIKQINSILIADTTIASITRNVVE